MRSIRALLASFGAGTCLVLAGTLAMATVSTIVAFSGLPGIRAQTAALPASVLAAAAPSAGTMQALATPRVVALPAVSTRASVGRAIAGRAPSRDTASAGSSSSTTLGDPPRTAGVDQPPKAGAPSGSAAAGGASGSSAGSKPSAAAVPAAPRPPAAGGPVGTAGAALGGAVAGVGGGVAKTVEPVAPGVSIVTGDAGKSSGATVTGATEAAAGALDGLLGGG